MTRQRLYLVRGNVISNSRLKIVPDFFDRDSGEVCANENAVDDADVVCSDVRCDYH